MKIPIPEDWDGETWECVQITWPRSTAWIALLNGLLSYPSRGRYWDERTGQVIDAQNVGRDILDRNWPLVPCAGQPEEPETPGEPATPTGPGAYWMFGEELECDNMPCIDISGLLKIEDGILYARDACCVWQVVGQVGNTLAIPDDLWDDQDPAPTYYACGKANIVIDALEAIVHAAYDAAAAVNPLAWVGIVEAAVPGYNLSNTWIANMVMEVAIAAALGYSEADITEANLIQTLKCQFVNLLDDSSEKVTSSQYDQLQGIINGVMGIVKANMWLMALAALGRGNVGNISLLGATDGTADCDCPQAIGFGQTDPTVDGWYLSPFFEIQQFDGGTEIYPVIALPSQQDVFGWVFQWLKSNGGGQYTPTCTLFHTDAEDIDALWDQDASELAQNTIFANGISQDAFDQVLGVGSYSWNTGGLMDWGTVESPVHIGPNANLGAQLHQQGGSEGSYSRWYGIRLLYNVNSPSHG